MLDVYKRLEREGVIGAVDANGALRPYQEYPKQVGKDERGNPIVVSSQREELLHMSKIPDAAKDDPVLADRNKLAEENAKLREELALALAKAPQLSPPSQPSEAGRGIALPSVKGAGKAA
jgi:hypothetical protein